ncbi:MAG: hypothetical protein OQL20_01500 [Sedimenticola sp.]|nr:hypothetical protein [Sedimenticola sp.]
MGKMNGFNHIGSQTLAGLVLLATASTTTLGTTQNFKTLAAGYGYPATTSAQQEHVVVENKRVALQHPSCTPGFRCKALNAESVPVSRRDVLKFALLIGAGNSR